MENDGIKNLYLIFMRVAENGTIRLFSFLATFIVWLSLVQIALFLVLFDVISLSSLQGVLQKFLVVLGLIGFAPIMIVFLSWRSVEWLCSWFITSYRKKHLTIEK